MMKVLGVVVVATGLGMLFFTARLARSGAEFHRATAKRLPTLYRRWSGLKSESLWYVILPLAALLAIVAGVSFLLE